MVICHTNLLTMKKEQEYLLKHFASILRGLALGKDKPKTIDSNVAHCLSRKDLIQILKKQFGGTIPKEHNLMEMEKSELLGLVKNEMLIISFMTEKWSNESLETIKKVVVPIQKETPKAPAKKKSDEKVSK